MCDAGHCHTHGGYAIHGMRRHGRVAVRDRGSLNTRARFALVSRASRTGQSAYYVP